MIICPHTRDTHHALGQGYGGLAAADLYDAVPVLVWASLPPLAAVALQDIDRRPAAVVSV